MANRGSGSRVPAAFSRTPTGTKHRAGGGRAPSSAVHRNDGGAVGFEEPAESSGSGGRVRTRPPLHFAPRRPQPTIRDKQVDVLFLPDRLAGVEIGDATVVVFDVLRATTTMAAALNAGV